MLEGYCLKTMTAAFSALTIAFSVFGVAHAQSTAPAPDLLTAHLKQPTASAPLKSRLTDRPLNLTRNNNKNHQPAALAFLEDCEPTTSISLLDFLLLVAS